ncbi:patatin-like phospholipase family protein [Siccirubricoccus sp. G192]|uniref:patatin-like phospholipase family protein n=1 Tax=Siccirubricoccus sp. G192 TaxID=2849651 RepID=UPI0020C4FD5D|nr:patatin-like phospholipase family protein [Siccirubricoccus sp. G192]
MNTPAAPPRPASYDKNVALVLQGGGALGSYQAGVYEALSTSDYLPDWIAGISIGALNAAIIAGNAPERRVDRLRQFWDGITAPPLCWPPWLDDAPGTGWGDHRQAAAAAALLFGQPGFFLPRPPAEWLFGTAPTSLYDTTALKGTLEALVDFDRINAREIRFSVGAVNVRTGDFAYFDNAEIAIRPEHVMASSALPPGFPAIEIDGEHYWDGGLVSNTPLQYVLTYVPRRSRLIFQVDLFPARGPLPTTLIDAYEREKDIRYSSRTRVTTDTLRQVHDVRHNINTLWDKLPEALRATPAAQFLYAFGCVTTMDIVELIDRPREIQGYAKDYEFSRRTMEARWARGRADAEAALRASPWLAPMPPELGARTFELAEAGRTAAADPA